MPTTPPDGLRRPLGPGLAVLASVLAFGVVAGVVTAVARMMGAAPKWAFALGWEVAFAVLVARYLLAQSAGARPFRGALVHIVLMGAIVVIVTLVLGERIFAHSS